ncbi:Uncharacterized protein APZ42_017369 [Daphnia magna]|uniref:Uncharacterized protein n=1 Tax=Daphnia magna TaxID=35525 RepID=A0A0P5ZN38_9CRUS|nr:Uncharacterized protein APZ42_017369 [Daphnia magna]
MDLVSQNRNNARPKKTLDFLQGQETLRLNFRGRRGILMSVVLFFRNVRLPRIDSRLWVKSFGLCKYHQKSHYFLK